MTESADSRRLAQLVTDLWFDDVAREHDHYPALVLTLGNGRTAEVLEVTYEPADNVLVIHCEEDA